MILSNSFKSNWVLNEIFNQLFSYQHFKWGGRKGWLVTRYIIEFEVIKHIVRYVSRSLLKGKSVLSFVPFEKYFDFGILH